MSHVTLMQQSSANDNGLLPFWIHSRITIFLNTTRRFLDDSFAAFDSFANAHTGLDRVLPLVTEASLRYSLLEQVMYCGFSLGRVGADFRGLVPSLFSEDIQKRFQVDVEKAVATFASSLHSHEWYISSAELTRLGIPMDTDAQLLEYPPLAILCNGFLHAFNTLGY